MTRPFNNCPQVTHFSRRLKAFKLLAQGKVRDSAPQPWVVWGVEWKRASSYYLHFDDELALLFAPLSFFSGTVKRNTFITGLESRVW